MLWILAVFYVLSPARSDSLIYRFTAHTDSANMSAKPEIVATGSLAGLTGLRWDPDASSLRVQIERMRDVFNDNYIQQETLTIRLHAGYVASLLKLIRNQNRTRVAVQLAAGCRTDGDAFARIAFDGVDQIYFDLQKCAWAAASNESTSVLKTFTTNLMQPEHNAPFKIQLKSGCLSDLRRGEAALTGLARAPVVRVTGTGGVYRCRAFGFFPRRLSMSWVRDDRDAVRNLSREAVLPNPDETFYAELAVAFDAGEESRYACRVAGVDAFPPSVDSNLALIGLIPAAGCLLGLLYVCWMRAFRHGLEQWRLLR